VQGGTLTLDSKSPADLGIPVWRSRITYIPQSRISPKGTPSELFYVAQVYCCTQLWPFGSYTSLLDGGPPVQKFFMHCFLTMLTTNGVGQESTATLSLVQQFSAQRRRPRGDLPALVHALGLEQLVLNQPWTELSVWLHYRRILSLHSFL
jgi:hypothetical protein